MVIKSFKLWPTQRQWKGWTLPSKLAVIAAYIGIIASLLTIASFFLSLSGRTQNTKGEKPAGASIYRLRVTVLNPQQLPVEDAKVWSSIGGEPKKVAGGWQFDIPVASVPADKKITIYAASNTAALTGQDTLQLGQDLNPTLIVQLAKDTSATVRGMVQDVAARAIPGAKVSVVGYGANVVATGEHGGFVLPAHTAVGQRIRLHIEAKGYKAKDQYHYAGDTPVTIVLESVHK